ncbi:hypothetical protein N7539_000649 [Penicillium diatomitis]|uniref:Uncharacterized protein n=1 Tax=Penicillium diatomitis TaxID=2819901 RepID=A0A9X0C2D7_9EURO|nr:uncharacterized protein N7539_000649 [Penicillium diatomitis]KAJ5495533.1 hypothetical protein N7539_000649 [Penicillium diatomitis]
MSRLRAQDCKYVENIIPDIVYYAKSKLLNAEGGNNLAAEEKAARKNKRSAHVTHTHRAVPSRIESSSNSTR